MFFSKIYGYMALAVFVSAISAYLTMTVFAGPISALIAQHQLFTALPLLLLQVHIVDKILLQHL